MLYYLWVDIVEQGEVELVGLAANLGAAEEKSVATASPARSPRPACWTYRCLAHRLHYTRTAEGNSPPPSSWSIVSFHVSISGHSNINLV